MSQIATEYRGHKIIYSDNAENWWCSDWDYSNASLAKVKARIDAEYLKIRKSAALDCFELTSPYQSAVKAIPAKIIEYLGEKWENDWQTKKPKLRGYQVASVAARAGNERPSRSTKMLSDFMPDTEEAHKALAEALRLRGIVREAEKAAQKAFEAIPRITFDMIGELARVSNEIAERKVQS